MFDRALASPIYGSSRARWRIGSQYYDADGQPISAEDAAMPGAEPPPDPVPVVPPGEYPSFHYPATAAPKPVTAPVVVEAPPALPTREQRLKGMTNTQLQKLVQAANGEPAKGPGANKRNIAWLLEHTEG